MKPGSFELAALHILARTFFSVVALGAIIWGGYFLPLFARALSPHRVALAYSQGRGFSNQTFVQQNYSLLKKLENLLFCNPIQLHDVVVLQLAVLYDASLTGSQTSIAESREALYGAIKRSLACAPSDAFVWLTLVLARRQQQRALSLKMQITCACRTRLAGTKVGSAFGAFASRFLRLPGCLLMFRMMLSTNLSSSPILGGSIRTMVDIFASAALTVQSRIIERFKTEDVILRQSFARALYNSGLDVDIPGVDPPAHPWRQ